MLSVYILEGLIRLRHCPDVRGHVTAVVTRDPVETPSSNQISSFLESNLPLPLSRVHPVCRERSLEFVDVSYNFKELSRSNLQGVTFIECHVR